MSVSKGLTVGHSQSKGRAPRRRHRFVLHLAQTPVITIVRSCSVFDSVFTFRLNVSGVGVGDYPLIDPFEILSTFNFTPERECLPPVYLRPAGLQGHRSRACNWKRLKITSFALIVFWFQFINIVYTDWVAVLGVVNRVSSSSPAPVHPPLWCADSVIWEDGHILFG